MITWKFIQNNSDSILSDGLWELKNSPIEAYTEISHNDFGNYLIAYDKKPYYIGEAKDICKRLKQQFKPTTSTFYKDYQKYLIKNKGLKPILIDSFRVQHMPTVVGRKEIEEFGIVNLPTLINSFQLGKRINQKITCHNGLWTKVQSSKADLFAEGETDVFKQPFHKWNLTKAPRKAGLYLVRSKSNELIYILLKARI